MKGRSLLPWFGLIAVLVLVVVLAGAPSTWSDRPLDPRAAGPSGARAAVVLLDELGADVDIIAGAPGGDVDTALLLDDRLDDDDRAELHRWVSDGGVLVVADPSSRLVRAGEPADCPQALEDVGTLSLGPGPAAELARGDDCYDGFVAARQLGEGDVVSVGDPRLFVNLSLADAENAVLVANLLAPTGEERVAFLQGPAGSGDRQLFDLLGPRVAQMLGQLGVALVIYVMWRGRRLGRPVTEGQPVRVAGSELVAAVGRMLGSRRRPGEAAATVRADLRRSIERRMGLAATTPVEQVAAAVAARTGLDAGWVALALAVRPVATDDDLLAVVADLDHIRALVLRDEGARSQPTTTSGGSRS